MGEGYAKEFELEADCQLVWEAGGYEVIKLSQPKPWLGTPGLPDAYVRRAGFKHGGHQSGRAADRLFVEYKIGKAGTKRGEPTDVQVEWHERERRAGGRVLVVHSPEDVAAYLKAQGINVRLEAT